MEHLGSSESLTRYRLFMFPGFRPSDHTDGERALFAAFVAAGLAGAWVTLIVTNRLLGEESLFFEFVSFHGLWNFIAGAIGTVSSIYLNRRWFGHEGLAGLRYTAGAILNTTFVATLIAGTFALPFYGTMFGPLAIVGTFWTSPAVLAIWLFVLAGVNLAYGVYRRERASVFEAKLPSETEVYFKRL